VTHYSIEHYADREVARGFDDLGFSGPVGRYLADEQERLLFAVLEPLARRQVLDVGTGTGRAALALAGAGAIVVGLDASQEMLDVAQARAKSAGVTAGFGRADAHALPLADGSVDAAVCFRVLMHVVDWRQALGELCRVARTTVIVDFPSTWSFAAIESRVRRRAQRAGRRVEAYRVLSEADVRRELEARGFAVELVRRQFVLPIAAHKAVGRLSVTRAVEGVLAAVGLLRLAGSPVTLVARR
jgi:ubiquinone/menaquinone biosynthesis C-methylase UbiE